MAQANPALIKCLRDTAERLNRANTVYRWSHQGACNCGHLAQTVTHLPAAEIHAKALEKAGDWSEKAFEYCPGSKYPIDHILESLWALGLGSRDIHHLENLSDPQVLARIPREFRPLTKNSREDFVLYLQVWADLLQHQDPARQSAGEEKSTANR